MGGYAMAIGAETAGAGRSWRARFKASIKNAWYVVRHPISAYRQLQGESTYTEKFDDEVFEREIGHLCLRHQIQPLAVQSHIFSKRPGGSQADQASQSGVSLQLQDEKIRIPAERKHQLAGLALSGGGIRSAAFACGVLQAFAEAKRLESFDYLSTVSGGGYAGTALTWVVNQCNTKTGTRFGANDFARFKVMAEQSEDAARSGSVPIKLVKYIRQRANYLAPNDRTSLMAGLLNTLRMSLTSLFIYAVLLVSVTLPGVWLYARTATEVCRLDSASDPIAAIEHRVNALQLPVLDTELWQFELTEKFFRGAYAMASLAAAPGGLVAAALTESPESSTVSPADNVQAPPAVPGKEQVTEAQEKERVDAIARNKSERATAAAQAEFELRRDNICIGRFSAFAAYVTLVAFAAYCLLMVLRYAFLQSFEVSHASRRYAVNEFTAITTGIFGILALCMVPILLSHSHNLADNHNFQLSALAALISSGASFGLSLIQRFGERVRALLLRLAAFLLFFLAMLAVLAMAFGIVGAIDKAEIEEFESVMIALLTFAVTVIALPVFLGLRYVALNFPRLAFLLDLAAWISFLGITSAIVFVVAWMEVSVIPGDSVFFLLLFSWLDHPTLVFRYAIGLCVVSGLLCLLFFKWSRRQGGGVPDSRVLSGISVIFFYLTLCAAGTVVLFWLEHRVLTKEGVFNLSAKEVWFLILSIPGLLLLRLVLRRIFGQANFGSRLETGAAFAGRGLCGLAAAAGFVLLLYVAEWVFAMPNPTPHIFFRLLGGMVLVVLIFNLLNPNNISPHRFYRDRLMEAFMPSPQPDNFKAADDAKLSDMFGAINEFPDRNAPIPPPPEQRYRGPYHLINTNAILVRSNVAKYYQRGGDSFTLSPLYCGSKATGWIATRHHALRLLKDKTAALTVATAMAISGAAANPNTAGGEDATMRRWSISFLMTLLNIRLGVWQPNPRTVTRRLRNSTPPPSFVVPGAGSLFSNYFHERKDYVELSDGGHFDNTGLYELFHRKARIIVLSDASCDPDYSLDDLSRALMFAQADFNVRIAFAGLGADESNKIWQQLDISPEQPNAYRGKGYPWLSDGVRAKILRDGYAIATIDYAPNGDGVPISGCLIYIKPALVEYAPLTTLSYALNNRDFPHQSTADQFFSEFRFEAYRSLGYVIAKKVAAEVFA